MSDERPVYGNANEAAKLLDRGWKLSLWKNQLGSYSAAGDGPKGQVVITDHFSVVEALHALSEKALGTGFYQDFDYEKEAQQEREADEDADESEEDSE